MTDTLVKQVTQQQTADTKATISRIKRIQKKELDGRKQVLQSQIKIGDELLKLKELTQHGGWLPSLVVPTFVHTSL